MSKTISIVGGDLRTVKLIELLRKEKYNIYTCGLEMCEDIHETEKVQLSECIQKNNIILSSIPLTKDKEKINAPFSKENIKVQELLNNAENKTIISGNIFDEYIQKYEKINFIDLLKDEELTILNSIPSAEGAIQIAMEQTQITLNGAKVLIMGFGRIGKILAKMLLGFGSEVYCEARKPSDIAWIKSYGYFPVLLEELESHLYKYDIIFNTIPTLILNQELLSKVNKDCVIIDLASVPGGVDFEQAKKLNIKTIWALGLPGKVAPITSAKYIKKILNKYI